MHTFPSLLVRSTLVIATIPLPYVLPMKSLPNNPTRLFLCLYWSKYREVLLEYMLVLCPMPIGPGNVALLREAVTAAQRGVSVILLNPVDHTSASEAITHDGEQSQGETMAARDYTGGEGLKLLEDLLQAGAVVVRGVGDVLEVLKKHDLHKI